MTPAQLKTLIESDAEAITLLAAKDDVACADRCSTIAPKVVKETILTERGLYVALGATLAETILQKLAGFASAEQSFSPIIARVLDWLKPNNGGVDFGDPQTIGLIGMLAQGGLFTAEEYTELIAIPMVSQSFTTIEIEYVRTRT